MTMFFEIIIME